MSGNHRYAIDGGVVADVSFVTAPISFKLSHLIVPAVITGAVLVLALVWNSTSLRDTSDIHTEARPLTLKLSQAVTQASKPHVAPEEPVHEQPTPVSEAVSAIESTVVESVPTSREMPVTPIRPDTSQPALTPKFTPPQRPARKAMVPTLSQPAVPVVPTQQDTQSTQAMYEHRELQVSYQAHIRQRIQKYKYYPKASRRLGEQGTVTLHFQINPDGSAAHIRVSQSSGHKRLDTAALRCVKRCGQFSKPPQDLVKDGMVMIHLPLHYGLKAASL